MSLFYGSDLPENGGEMNLTAWILPTAKASFGKGQKISHWNVQVLRRLLQTIMGLILGNYFANYLPRNLRTAVKEPYPE